MALPDYQDESKIIPSGFVDALKRIQEKGKKIEENKFAYQKIIELLGEERVKNSTFQEIINAIESLVELRSKSELKSKLNLKEILEYYENHQKNITETRDFIKTKYGEKGVQDFIRQQEFLKKLAMEELPKQNLSNKNVTTEKPITQPLEINLEKQNLSSINVPQEEKYIPRQEIGYEKPELNQPPIITKEPEKKEIVKDEFATTEEIHEETLTKKAFDELMGNIENLGKMAADVRKQEQQRQQTEEEAKMLAMEISQKIIEAAEEEKGIVFQNDDKKIEAIEQSSEIIYDAILGNEEFSTDKELVEKIIELAGAERFDDKEIEKIIIEVQPIKTAEKWAESHEEQISEIRAEKIGEEIFDLYKDNQEVKKENVIEYTKLVKEFVVKTPKIRKELKDKIMEKDLEKLSSTEIEKRITDVETWARVTEMSPKEFKKFIEKYENARNKLKGNLPLRNKRVISLDNFTRSFKNLPKQQQNFVFQLQRQRIFIEGNYFSNFFIKTQNFFSQWNNNFVGGIRGDRIVSFFQNSFGFLKNGFSPSFFSGMKGLFSKTAGMGSKLLTGIVGKSTPWGAVLTTAKSILSKLGGFLDKFLKSTGLDPATGLKNFFSGTLGFLGTIPNFFIDAVDKTFKGAATLIVAVVVAIFIFLPASSKAKSNSTMPFVPLFGNITVPQIDTGDIDNLTCSQKGGYTPPSTEPSYVLDLGTTKVDMYVFEKGSTGGRMKQIYDLEASASAFLKPILSKYNGGTENNRLDSRVIPAYQAMVDAGESSGQLSFPDDLKLTSGYRSVSSQQIIWDKRIAENRSKINSGVCPDGCKDFCDNASLNAEEKALSCTRRYVAFPGCSPHHTGRAVDIWINGSAGNSNASVYSQQRNSSTFRWLYGTDGTNGNAAKFGFYNFEKEPWHWEYNPIDKPKK